MAFLLRLRTTHTLATSSPSLSLLHNHHNHRPLSTSNSGAGDYPNSASHVTPFISTFSSIPSFNSNSTSYFVCKKQLQILTSSLVHHNRLLCTSISDSGADTSYPSPSLLRELREVFKQLSAHPSDSNPTSSSTFSSPSPSELDKKLDQLKVAALSLRQKQVIDYECFLEFEHSRVAFMHESLKNLGEFIKPYKEHEARGTMPPPETHQRWGHEFDTSCIGRARRLKEMTMKTAQMSEVLTNSRLASLFEIVENLSQLREDLQDEVWNELNEELMRCKETELKRAALVVEKVDDQLAFVEQRINDLCEIHRKEWGW